MEHPEPEFIDVPIQQLLPDKWHSDYVRACGGGEKGEQTRMNYLGYYQPDIPKATGLNAHLNSASFWSFCLLRTCFFL